MRRTASEIIRNLERRIARLENKSAGFHDYEEDYAYDSSDSYSQPFKDDYYGRPSNYAEQATVTAKQDKRLLNQAGKRLGCMITKVKEGYQIQMVCKGSDVILSVKQGDADTFVVSVNGKTVNKFASGYWGDMDSHTGGSDRELQNRYVEFLQEEIIPHC
jgi:hypothetical protein